MGFWGYDPSAQGQLMTTPSTNLISQLRATLGKMEIALGAIDEAIVWTDEKGSIQWCNTSFNLLVGRTHLEILGARLFELLPIEHEGQGLLPEQHPLVRALKGPDKAHGTYEFSKGASRSILEITAAGIQLNEQDKTVILAIHDITERKQTEEKLARSHERLELRVAERTEDLSKAHIQLLALSRRLIQSQETERRRISLELHGQLGQELALLSIHVEQLNQKAPESQAELAERLRELAIQIRRVSSQVHNLSHQLHPSALEHVGLVAASRSLCMEVSKASGIQIDFSHTSVPSLIPQDVSICLFRVLQESLTNIVKHSEVQAAQVELAGGPDKLQLYVCDSGVGFSPESVGNDGGLGFVSRRERLSLVGGELLIDSQPSVGTQIKVCVPLNSSASPD